MNIYETIKEGIQNNLTNQEIINQLGNISPNLEYLIEETRKLFRREEEKIITTSTEIKHFLQRLDKDIYIDLVNGRKYEAYTKLPYEKCNHGLCEKEGGQILKRIYESKLSPNVFIAIELEPIQYQEIEVQFTDGDKKPRKYIFDSMQIREFYNGIDEGLDDKKLSIRLCCSLECIRNLTFVINKREGIENGRKRSRSITRGRNNFGGRFSGMDRDNIIHIKRVSKKKACASDKTRPKVVG